MINSPAATKNTSRKKGIQHTFIIMHQKSICLPSKPSPGRKRAYTPTREKRPYVYFRPGRRQIYLPGKIPPQKPLRRGNYHNHRQFFHIFTSLFSVRARCLAKYGTARLFSLFADIRPRLCTGRQRLWQRQSARCYKQNKTPLNQPLSQCRAAYFLSVSYFHPKDYHFAIFYFDYITKLFTTPGSWHHCVSRWCKSRAISAL